jgi:DNA repair protein RecO (recombination protein O)
MSDSHLYKTEAIVLKRSDLGEADRLLALFTPHLGRIRAVAKGARKTTSRLGGHVELFTHVQLMIARGRNLDYVTQAQTLNPFISIRDDLVLMGHACYLAELVDQIAGEHITNEALYALLLTSLQSLPPGVAAVRGLPSAIAASDKRVQFRCRRRPLSELLRQSARTPGPLRGDAQVPSIPPGQ